MIKLEDSHRHNHCNSCRSTESLKDIRVSITGEGDSITTLCEKCQLGLLTMLIENLGTKKTIKEWSEVYEIKIIDPDGFNREDPELMTRLFTQREFFQQMMRSTIEAVGDGTGYYKSKTEAMQIQDELNYAERNTSPCTTRQMTKEEWERYFGEEKEANND